ncbi:MAG: DUF1080 domain-containing protein [Flavisolibacter sp.]|nr:DUF1080 domain-containing protein [Flavisolibacter sp.]
MDESFNGKDLKDWIIKIKDHPLGDNYGNTFRVQDGLLTVSYDQSSSFNKQYGHIYYKQLFSWYLLVLEYLAKLRVIAFLMVQDY